MSSDESSDEWYSNSSGDVVFIVQKTRSSTLKPEEVLSGMKKFIENTDVNSLERASDWKIWSEKLDELVPLINKFAKNCHELNENLAKNTNWKNLPVEMKLECIKRMDFPTKIMLRKTGKLEKSLVDSEKLTLSELAISMSSNFSMEFRSIKNGAILRTSPKIPFDCFLQSFVYLLKNCEIESLKYVSGYSDEKTEENYVDSMLSELQKCAPVKFSNIDITANSALRIPLFLLENCVSDFQKLNIRVADENKNEILAMSKPFPAKHVRFEGNCDKSFLAEFLDKFIESDPPIGYCFEPLGRFPQLTKKFRDSIVSHDDENVRIRMDDPKKHIFVDKSSYNYVFKIIDASSDLKQF